MFTPQPVPRALVCCRPLLTASLSIGVDANQNHLHPGKVLTSMLKRVDVAVYNVMKSGKDGTFKAPGQSQAWVLAARWRGLCHG